MSTKTSASPPIPRELQFAVGTYTGNGAATQAIIGIGFQPKHVWINHELALTTSDDNAWGLRIDLDGAATKLLEGTGVYFYRVDHIISLDADGFTVGDGTGYIAGNVMNINQKVYHYYAWG